MFYEASRSTIHLNFLLLKIKEVMKLCTPWSCLLFSEVFQWLEKKRRLKQVATLRERQNAHFHDSLKISEPRVDGGVVGVLVF